MRERLSTGTRHYRLRRKLSVGKLSEIWLAQVETAAGHSQDVAVKRMLPAAAAEPRLRDLFFREARLTASLQHPNVVGVHEIGVDDPPFFVMEYLPGPSLAQLIAHAVQTQTSPPLAWILELAQDALRGLAVAHSHIDPSGVPTIHRDLAPSNLLLDATGRLKLSDFGVAASASSTSVTDLGTLRGSYAYMSPEQITMSVTDTRSDIFSLALSVLELATAHRVFDFRNEFELIAAIPTDHAQRFAAAAARVPLGLRSILTRALAPLPEHRFASAHELARELEKWRHACALPSAPSFEIAPWLELRTLAVASDTHRSADNITMITENPTLTAHIPAPRMSAFRPRRAPDSEASLAVRRPLAWLHDIAACHRTGLWAVENASAHHYVFFASGHPCAMISDDPALRFSDYVANEQRLPMSEVWRATELAPLFGGHLLRVMTALDGISRLEAETLANGFARTALLALPRWSSGHAGWFEGVAPSSSLPLLHLDTFDVITASMTAISSRRLQSWLRRHATLRACRTGAAVGSPIVRTLPGAHEFLMECDGSRTLAQLIPAAEAGVAIGSVDLSRMRLAYILCESGLIASQRTPLLALGAPTELRA